MNLIEAVKRACEEPTYTKALAWIAVWENERIVQYVRTHEGQFDTCFYLCFHLVAKEWVKQGKP